MLKQTERDEKLIGYVIEERIKERDEILEVLRELLQCSTNPWNDEQAQRKLIAQANAEDILRRYNMIK